MLAGMDVQLYQLLGCQILRQLIDGPPERPVPDADHPSACGVVAGHAPSVPEHYRCGHVHGTRRVDLRAGAVPTHQGDLDRAGEYLRAFDALYAAPNT